MVGGARLVMRLLLLLLLSSIRAGVNGDDCIICSQSRYDITHPCGEDACVHIWHFSTSVASDYVAIVSNGEIQGSRLPDDDSKCSVAVEDLSSEDVGPHRCQPGPGAPSPHNAFQVVDLRPGKAVSVQCVLLTFVQKRHCFTASKRLIRLTWVDETNAVIQEDSQHQIKQQSDCDVTLTITLQSPQTRKFRCLVKVGRQVQTSEELWVRLAAPKGRRGGHAVDILPEHQDNQDVIGGAVGVVACVALTAFLVAAVVINRRRRANFEPPGEPMNTIRSSDVSVDDVIYADVILPDGSQAAWVQDRESTEYASVRYS